MKEEIKNIGFIGGGNMAEAFIKGLMVDGMAPGNIFVSEPNQQRREWIGQAYGVCTLGTNPELVRLCSTIVLAIKPQIANQVLSEVSRTFDRNKLIISFLAGVTTATIEKLLGENARVIRAMPNTPALIGAGAAAICPGQHAEEKDLELAKHLFKKVGTVEQVEEAQMDTVTGLSGSGPAFVYAFIEALVVGGVREGLRLEIAHSLAVQTVLGATLLLKESGAPPALLCEKVCSPGGATISAMRVLEDRVFRSIILDAVGTATRRSKELNCLN